MTRWAATIALMLVVLLVMASAAPGYAQGRANCAPRASALQQLAEKWGETRRSVMLANGAVFEVYAADETGTWTILATMPDGQSCVVASGVAYEAMPLPVSGEPM